MVFLYKVVRPMYGLKKERNTGRFMKTYPVRVPQTRLESTELGNAERNAVPYLGIRARTRTARTCVHAYTLVFRAEHEQVHTLYARPSTFLGERKNPKKGQCSIYYATFNLTRRVSFPPWFLTCHAFLNHLTFVQALRFYLSVFVRGSYFRVSAIFLPFE